MVRQQVALQKPKCQAGGDCARTRAALNWPDHLPCVDPSKVSVPVDKSIALLKWFESLGHSVPELRELEAIKRRHALAAPHLHVARRSRLMSEQPWGNLAVPVTQRWPPFSVGLEPCYESSSCTGDVSTRKLQDAMALGTGRTCATQGET